MWFSNLYVCVDQEGMFAEAEVSGEFTEDDGSFWSLDAIDEVEVDGLLFDWEELQAWAPSLAHALAVEIAEYLESDPEYVQECIQDEYENAYDAHVDLAISAAREDRA